MIKSRISSIKYQRKLKRKRNTQRPILSNYIIDFQQLKALYNKNNYSKSIMKNIYTLTIMQNK